MLRERRRPSRGRGEGRVARLEEGVSRRGGRRGQVRRWRAVAGDEEDGASATSRGVAPLRLRPVNPNEVLSTRGRKRDAEDRGRYRGADLHDGLDG